MREFLQQHSYVFISLGVVVALMVVLRILRVRWRYTLATTGVIATILTQALFILRPGLSDVADLRAAEAMFGNGRPTFMEFFSNYCAGCVLARPAVDRIVDEIEDQFNVLRVDIHTEFGRELRRRYDFSYTPEFVLFDRAGQEVWRDHVPPASEQLALVENPVTELDSP
jgi:thiol-disulfide isomerase/thioredoxin